MIIAPVTYRNALASGQYPLLDLYSMVLANGTVLRFTAWDTDIYFGGNKYSAFDQGVTVLRSGVTKRRGVESSKLSVTLAYDSASIAVAGYNLARALDRGLLTGAVLTLYRAVAYAPRPDGASDADAVVYGLYIVTDASPDRGKIVFDCVTPTEYFNQDIPWRKFGLNCDWTLYGPGCLLNKANFACGGSVLTGSTASRLVCAGLNTNPASPDAGAVAPSGYFNQGVLQFTSGALNGLRTSVMAYAAAGLADAYDNLVLADKPMAFYKLDANVNDSTSHGYHGVNHGITFSASGGPLADASGYGVFSGTPNFVDISAIPHPRNQTSYLGGVSLELFYWTTDANMPDFVFDSGGDILNIQGNVPIRFHAGVGNTPPAMRWGVNHPLNPFGAVSGAWTHVVGIFRGGRYVDVFVNGLLVATTTDKGLDLFSWVNSTLGKVTGAGFYKGRLSRVAIYGYAMDPQQIYTHYVSSKTVHTSVANAGLSLALPFPEAPAAGDTFIVYPGCDKTLRRCTFTFNNLVNNGSHPFIPSQEAGM